MRVAVMSAPGEVRVEDRPEPTILKPTDAVIRLSATCICGSDRLDGAQVEADITSIDEGGGLLAKARVATGRAPSVAPCGPGPANQLAKPLFNTDSGPVGAITDLRNLMTGGGTITASTSEHMLAEAGFADVRVLDLPGGTVLCTTVT